MKEFFDKFWHDMVFARSVVIALAGLAVFYVALPVGRPWYERLGTAAVAPGLLTGSSLSSRSGLRGTDIKKIKELQ